MTVHVRKYVWVTILFAYHDVPGVQKWRNAAVIFRRANELEGSGS